jgi:hypothetical protein
MGTLASGLCWWYQVTYSTVQDIIWNADSHSACQKYSSFLWNLKVHWTLSWASWIRFVPSISISLRSSLMLSSHLCLGLPGSLLPSGFPTKTYWELEIQRQSFFDSALEGDEWLEWCSGRFNPRGKEYRYPLCRRLGGPTSSYLTHTQKYL